MGPGLIGRQSGGHARWAASALVETGVPIERITSLRDLVHPVARAEAILQLLYARAGNGPSSRGTHVADVLRIIARHIEQVSPEDVAVIVELGTLVRRKYEGLTKKNRGLHRPSHAR